MNGAVHRFARRTGHVRHGEPTDGTADNRVRFGHPIIDLARANLRPSNNCDRDQRSSGQRPCPSYDPKLLIDKDRVHEAEPLNGPRNQVDLSLEMRARVARPWLQCVRREPLNLGSRRSDFRKRWSPF